MHKYLTTYLKRINYILSSEDEQDFQKLLKDHLLQIQFMQHERQVHFNVVMLMSIALCICVSILLTSYDFLMMILVLLIVMLLIPYIIHYYFLENSVQSMYDIYRILDKRAELQEEKRVAQLEDEKQQQALLTKEEAEQRAQFYETVSEILTYLKASDQREKLENLKKAVDDAKTDTNQTQNTPTYSSDINKIDFTKKVSIFDEEDYSSHPSKTA